MALTPAQIREVLAAVGAFIEKRRPREEIRPQLDYRADINGSTATIVAQRPAYDNPREILNDPIARVRWIGTQKKWRLYWMRADLKWHIYDPQSEIRTIADALAEIDRDPFCCFFG